MGNDFSDKMLANQVNLPLMHLRLMGNIASGKTVLVSKLKIRADILRQLVLADEPMEMMETYLKMVDSGSPFSALTVQLGVLECIRIRDANNLAICRARMQTSQDGEAVKFAQLLSVRGPEDVQDIFTRVNYLTGSMTETECSIIDRKINGYGGIRPCQGLIWIACGERANMTAYRARLSARDQNGDKYALRHPDYLAQIERAYLDNFTNFTGDKLRLECNDDPDENCNKVIEFLHTVRTHFAGRVEENDLTI